MNIICSICKEQLLQSDDIFHTLCSHVFHFNCLIQWLERSKSCPQCREKVTQSKIHRLYFTFSNNESVDSQTPILQERIDNLEFKILLKEKDIQYYTSKTITLEKQNAGLKQEVHKIESEISKQNSIIYELKEQTKYSDDLKKEIEKLKPIQMLLHGSMNDVHEIIGKTKDPQTLTTYISVMKKILTETSGKRKQLRMTVKNLQEELAKTKTKYVSLLEERMDLDEKLALSESQNMSLQQRINNLEEVLGNVLESHKTDTRNICKKSPHEKTSKKEKSHDILNKSSTPTKRKKEKVSLHSIKNSDIQTENNLTDSEVSLTNFSSSTESPKGSKRSRMSNDNKNISNKSSNNKSTKFILKKKKENIAQTSTTDNVQNNSIIDLT